MKLVLNKILALVLCFFTTCVGQNQHSAKLITNLFTDVATAIGSPEQAPLEIARDVAIHFGLQPTPQNVTRMLAAMADAVKNLSDVNAENNAAVLLEAAQKQTHLPSNTMKLLAASTAVIIGSVIVYWLIKADSNARIKREAKLQARNYQEAQESRESRALGKKVGILNYWERVQKKDASTEDRAAAMSSAKVRLAPLNEAFQNGKLEEYFVKLYEK